VTGPRHRRRFAPRWRFTLLLPVTYNLDDPLSPGGGIPGAAFVEVEERLAAQFGGFTKLTAPGYPVVEGQWRDPATGEIASDRHRRYEIVADRRQAHNEFLLDLHADLLHVFRQAEIFLTRESVYLAVDILSAG
jgi:hypothetical protein